MLALLPCVAPRLRHLHPVWFPTDFCVYFAGARLVSRGQSAALYTGADDGKNAPKVIVGPGTPLYEAVREYRLQALGYYIYPPLLADLLVPLAHMDLFVAWKVWLGLNGVLLAGTGCLLVALLRLRPASVGSAVLFLALFCFAPVTHCLAVGQVTILLLFLWCLGLVLQQRNLQACSAAAFALAAAIKLTPALVLVPFLFWRRWRWVTWFVAVLAGLLGLCALLNTPQSLETFFIRVTPAMSNAIPDTLNFSIAAATERLLMALHGGAYNRLLDPPPAFHSPFFQGVPPSIYRAGKGISCIFALCVLTGLYRRTTDGSAREQVLVLSMLGFVSALLSPVSWFNAYAVAFVAFAVLWVEVLQTSSSAAYLLGLFCVSVLFGSPMLTNLTIALVRQQHFLLAACLEMFGIVAAGGLLLYRLWKWEPTVSPTELASVGAFPCA